MPSVRYFNQTAPFWDFVADMEDQRPSISVSSAFRSDAPGEHDRPNPWSDGWPGFPWGSFPHRGRHGPHPPPPPPPQHDGSAPPPPPADGESDPEAGPSDDNTTTNNTTTTTNNDNTNNNNNQQEPTGHRGRREHHHSHEHGGWRGRHGGYGRGGFGPRTRTRVHLGPYGAGSLGDLADMFQNQFFSSTTTANVNAKGSNEFKPEVDVFDTTDAFVVHLSLPGAKKEDIAVSWDAEKSELAVSGIVHRPGDEELLKTLALDERRVGAFDRKLRLGSRANPAQVDADAISARMEDGVLRIDVPKLDAGYVEIKKVDIE